MTFMGGIGYLSDEYLTPEPYGLVLACTLGGLEMTRRIFKTLNYAAVESLINERYDKQRVEKHRKSMDSLRSLLND
jgi:F0F1-type ATP synthase assembly protein I